MFIQTNALNIQKQEIWIIGIRDTNSEKGIFMKGIIKKGSVKAFALAAACLISVSDAGFPGSADVCIEASVSEVYKTWRQGDSRWGDLHLGKSVYTMSSSGCAATSVAVLLAHAGNFNDSNFDPGIFCKLMNQFGGFGSNGDIIWGVASRIAPGFVFQTTDYSLEKLTREQKIQKLKKYCDDGYYMIIDVNSHHWVALDRVENGTVYCFDPATGKNCDAYEVYGFEGNTCVKLFKSESISDAPPQIKYTYKKGIYEIYADELKVRKTASVSSEKIGVLEKGMHVEVTDVSGNWGKIQYRGSSAWICLDYTTMIVSAPEGSAAVTQAPVTTTVKPVTQTPVTTTARPVTQAPVTTTAKPVTQAPVTTTAKPVTQASVTTTAKQTSVSSASVTVQTTPAVTTAVRTYKTGAYKTSDYLNYRAGSNVNAEKYGVIPQFTNINVYEVSANWGRTEYGGKSCWVCLDYADFISGTFINAEPAVTTANAVTTVPVTTTAKVTTAASVTSKSETASSPAVTTVPVTTALPVAATTAPVTAATVKTTEASAELPVTTVKITEALSSETAAVTDSVNYLFRCRTTDALNLRTGAGTDNDIICVIPNGTDLTVYEIDANDRWGRVGYGNKAGWVCLDYVALIEESTQPSPEPAVTVLTEAETTAPESQASEPSVPEIGAAEESAVIAVPDGGIVRGDVDRNGFINILDYIRLKSYFAGEYTFSEEADVNNDGIVNISDLITLRKIFIKII